MRRNRFLLICIALIALGVFLAAFLLRSEPETLYRIRFLPALGGGRSVIPHSINDLGHIVGVAEMSSNQWHTFIWDKDEGIRDLGPYSDTRHGHTYVRINNVGQIASTSVDPNGNPSAFLLDPNGVKTILKGSNNKRIHIQALNNQGQIVGYYGAERGPRMAFIWDKTTGMKDLGPRNTIESLAYDLNDSGRVVGFLSAARSNQWYAFICNPNTGMWDLGVTRFGPTGTCYINNRGGVVGLFGANDDTTVSMWTKKQGVQKLPSFIGTSARVVGLTDTNCFLVCLDHGKLNIGQFGALPHTTSFICDPNGNSRDIARSLGRKDVIRFVATGINNKGQIIGLLFLKKQPDSLGVILEPIQ